MDLLGSVIRTHIKNLKQNKKLIEQIVFDWMLNNLAKIFNFWWYSKLKLKAHTKRSLEEKMNCKNWCTTNQSINWFIKYCIKKILYKICIKWLIKTVSDHLDQLYMNKTILEWGNLWFQMCVHPQLKRT